MCWPFPKIYQRIILRPMMFCILALLCVFTFNFPEQVYAATSDAPRNQDEFEYHTYDSLQSDLELLQSTYPNIVKLENIGTTEENRTIWAVKISDNVNAVENENRVLFVGAHHAREWISVEVPFHLAKYLAESYGSDPLATSIVNNQETWIVPMLNPDGHVYSTKSFKRCWRKNRSDNGFPSNWYQYETVCKFSGELFEGFSRQGTDLNRNFGGPNWGRPTYSWGFATTSSDPSSNVYSGRAAFSERETQAIRNLVSQHSFVGAISYHNFGQDILYPWGYKKSRLEITKDYTLLSTLAQEMSREIKAIDGRTYEPKQSAAMYPTTGDFVDWVYSEFKIPVFTFELRPSSGGFLTAFALPEDQIEDTWLENKAAALHLLDFFNLQVDSPSTNKPAYAGENSSPSKIDLNISGPWRTLLTSDVSVKIKINGIDASIIAVKRLPEITAQGSQNGFLLQIQPPVQQTSGLFDLVAQIGDAEILVADSVQYGEVNSTIGSSVAVVIDRSPSMYPDCSCTPDNPRPSEDRIGAAKIAAKTFVDLLSTGDQISIVGFDQNARVYYQLSTLDQENVAKQNARDAVDSIGKGNATSIGDGLRAGLNQLANTNSSQPKAIILLTDGFENRAELVADVLPDAQASGIPVYVIGLGLANQAQLNEIATSTGGKYYFTASPDNLTEIYQDISSTVDQQQTILSESNKIVELNQIDETSVTIDPSISTVTFLVTWGGSDLDLTLVAPDNTVITPTVAAADPSIQYSTGPTLEFYRIESPQPGTWTMRTKGIVVDMPGGEPYTARAVANTSLPMKLFLDGGRLAGDPIFVSALLADSQPITQSIVLVQVDPPAPSDPTFITLFDDGTNGDTTADDGVYTNIYTDTSRAGTYQFVSNAAGLSTVEAPFTREAIQSTFVAERPLPPQITSPEAILAAPGASVTTVFTVSNSSDVPATYSISFGPPEEILWADIDSIPNSVSIGAQESIQIPINISVPPAEENPSTSLFTLAATNELEPTSYDSGIVGITVPFTDLSISAQLPTTTTIGNTAVYNINVANVSQVNTSDVVILLKLEDGFTFVSDSLSDSTVDEKGVRSWFIPELNASQADNFSISISAAVDDIASAERVGQIYVGNGATRDGAGLFTGDANVLNNITDLEVFVIGQAPTSLAPISEPDQDGLMEGLAPASLELVAEPDQDGLMEGLAPASLELVAEPDQDGLMEGLAPASLELVAEPDQDGLMGGLAPTSLDLVGEPRMEIEHIFFPFMPASGE